MTAASSLPSELWLEIFEWATFYPDAYATSYKPFCTTAFSESQPTCRDTVISCSLALVCRLWRALVAQFLYRDVRIGHSQNTLKGALCDEQGYGRFVRRAVLPFQYTSTPAWSPAPLPSVEILKFCNRLEVLIRPRSPPLSVVSEQFQFDADSLPLPSLKRLEWNYNPDAEHSGGINSLGATLQNTPNLQYLLIGSVPRSPMMDFRKVSLPFLETLAISSLSGQLMHQISYRWALPSLSHIVLGALSIPDMSCLWEVYGGQIKSLELGRHASFLVRDVITSALNNCPQLEELNYYMFFTLPPILHDSHDSIHTVGLHSAPNLMFSSDDNWILLERHLHFLTEYLSSFHTLRLFGDWSQILTDSRFAPIYVKLRQRGCQIVV
ncbi:hypothetical protein J3R30DRAFT_3697078 [Lentinula aciculospora]|uniref:F-box domain-containing protein n=1 Tax=Lentinula aciculospora TaxID=153920 RepID=A0A9W9AM75_9AGAR|nr:hypothetical protein J3R30DRAFT_3697078 [Lentinula aciculospora]